MPHILQVVELALAIVGALLLQWNARDRIAMPDVRPLRSLRWWFPWPREDEFRTRRAYRVEQLGRGLALAFTLLVAMDLLRGIV